MTKEKTRAKDSGEKLGFLVYLGTTLMSFTYSFASGLMTTWFMTYLTDYAGIGALGATLGAGLLLVARVFDAVNDPLEGWLMDRAKPGKLGKYKPFIMLSIVLQALGISLMFFLPTSIHSNAVAVCAWVLVGYLIYDIGTSFFAPNLIYRSLTMDSGARSKLMIAPRLVNMVAGMVVGGIIALVNMVNGSLNDLHTSFGVVVLAMMVGSAIPSLLGCFMFKERYVTVPDSDERVKFSDFFLLIKENKPLRTYFLAAMFSGFIWTFLFSAVTYYIKWGYCADLTTGAVDSATFSSFSLVSSMMMIFPLILGTMLSVPLMKVFKTPARTWRFTILLQAISCGVLFVAQVLGFLQSSVPLFFVCLAVCSTSIGTMFIPAQAISIETMDYEIYVNGKDRSALCNATKVFLEKSQSAISASIVGIILIAVGYEVNSTTGEYVGALEALPGMLNWFIVVMGLVPCILGAISWLIMKGYPITQEFAEKMKSELATRQLETGQAEATERIAEQDIEPLASGQTPF